MKLNLSLCDRKIGDQFCSICEATRVTLPSSSNATKKATSNFFQQNCYSSFIDRYLPTRASQQKTDQKREKINNSSERVQLRETTSINKDKTEQSTSSIVNDERKTAKCEVNEAKLPTVRPKSAGTKEKEKYQRQLNSDSEDFELLSRYCVFCAWKMENSVQQICEKYSKRFKVEYDANVLRCFSSLYEVIYQRIYQL